MITSVISSHPLFRPLTSDITPRVILSSLRAYFIPSLYKEPYEGNPHVRLCEGGEQVVWPVSLYSTRFRIATI